MELEEKAERYVTNSRTEEEKKLMEIVEIYGCSDHKERVEDIKNICKIYKEMTFDGHKPKEGLEKARCMLFAHKYYYEEIKNCK